ncbi:MAG: hypothetical protein WD708_06500, partial [Kiritimatiellia bacterium]
MQKNVHSLSRLQELDDRDDVAYWRSQSPESRWEALELLRQTFYGYDPTTTRLSRFFEIIKPG